MDILMLYKISNFVLILSLIFVTWSSSKTIQKWCNYCDKYKYLATEAVELSKKIATENQRLKQIINSHKV